MTDQDNTGVVAPTSSEQGLLVDDDKRAEEQCESECKLRQIIEMLPSFLWSADPTGEPTYINQRILDYSGMRFDEFKHLGWEAFRAPDRLSRNSKSLRTRN